MQRRLTFSVFLSLFLSYQINAQESCSNLEKIMTFNHAEIGAISIHKDSANTTQAVAFSSQMHVNTDGAPDSYHPDNIGITHICNGVSVGPNCQWKPNCLSDFNKAKAENFTGPTKICFFAMVTDAEGAPILQKADDPKPGYFISTTAFKQPGVSSKTAQAQLDSNEVPFIVVPSQWHKQEFQGIRLGDFAVVVRKSNKAMSFAVVGDLGPRKKLGEGSVALHKALENDPFMLRPDGHIRAFKGIGPRDVVYIIFPGSRKTDQVVTNEIIKSEGEDLLAQFGGKERLLNCIAQL